MTTRDIAEQDFDAQVVQASHERAVVVDFWAPWCGPCHALAPVLERVAARYAGDVDLVKVNVDEAPSVARQHRVQGIPAVKAFRDGNVVAEFVGVQPEPAVDRLFAAAAPTEADRLTTKAERAQDVEERESLLRRALDLQRDHAGAVVALARLLLDRAQDPAAAQEVRGLLARVPSSEAARRLLAQLELMGPADAGDTDALRQAADAGDAQAALRLGRALAAGGEHEQALPYLMVAVRDSATREDARAVVLSVFELLGTGSPLVSAWRPKLAAALF